MTKAKDLQVSKWLNAPPDFNLDLGAPHIKVIHAFQMLCPGCVYMSIPQAKDLHRIFENEPVQIIGLHTVFEHHDVMTPEALAVFIKEWRLPFPVGIDRPGKDHWMPETMKAYNMQGTPTLLIIDHTGELRVQHFGHVETETIVGIIKNLINQAKAA